MCWPREPCAGGTGPKGLEVVLIHRPKYNDWSWPKGKVDPGETLPETAVREVKEETGFDIRLGIPLPTAEYKVGKNTKKVFYWSAEVRGDAASPR
jgi:8-oxo-dGTP pyrophosphatase MutT (NUDIX family)